MIPTLASLPAPPRRIILHWTGGSPEAGHLDRLHYHFIVQQDGTAVPGLYEVAANMRDLIREPGEYAAHTGGLNSYSVGIAFAGMAGAESPEKPGWYPLLEAQVRAGCRFVAECCRAWQLDPTSSAQLFTHAEAWRIHRVQGAMNHQKQDILYLPHRPELGEDEVGPWLRRQAFEAYLYRRAA